MTICILAGAVFGSLAVGYRVGHALSKRPPTIVYVTAGATRAATPAVSALHREAAWN